MRAAQVLGLAVNRFIPVTFLAVQLVAQHRIPACFGFHPGPTDQWRVVPDVLIMPAIQLGNPVVEFVLVITDYGLLHWRQDFLAD